MRALLFLALLISAQATLAQVSVYPPAPKAQETVRVQVPPGGWHVDPRDATYPDHRQTRVTMSGNRITVSVQPTAFWPFGETPTPGMDLAIGQFPEGAYEVAVTMRSADGASLGTLGTVAFTVSARDIRLAAINATGLWWVPSQSGWGVNIVQNGAGALFATWFMYDDVGRATWYHLSNGSWDNSGVVYSGQLFRTTGPAMGWCIFSGGPCPGAFTFDSSAVTRVPVGTAAFVFDPVDFDKVSMKISVDGKWLDTILRRLSF
jgi:hypothetical protein